MNRQQGMNPARVDGQSELPPPPRFLLWLVIGLFILAILGGAAGVYIFANVLRPGQQERIIGILPFMEVFLNRPAPDTVLPTAAPQDGSSLSPDDLLNMPLVASTVETTATPVPTLAVTQVESGIGALPTPTLVPTFTPTPLPTLTPTPLPPTPEPPAPSAPDAVSNLTGASVVLADTASLSLPSSARLYGFQHVKQTWNNCGPANITMALSYYGWREDQKVAADYLKPDPEDKNVNPGEMVSFVNERSGVRAITRIGGDITLLKAFLAAQFPLVIETGYMPEGYAWIGHYQTVVGYDDSQRVFYVYDSYLGSGENGEGMAVSYDDFDRNWQAFSRVFIVIYLRERESEVQAILGDRADVTAANELALAVAQEEARANPQNEFAWFNMGTALTKLKRYEQAAAAYDRALQLGLNFRMLWYQFGPFEAYYNVRRFDDVLALVNANLNGGAQYVEETYYWQGLVFAEQGKLQQARESFSRALMHNPRYTAAQSALNALPSQS